MNNDINTSSQGGHVRTGRELIKASMPFAKEDIKKSWFYTISTIVYIIAAFFVALKSPYWSLSAFSALLFGLLLVRFFILYHDYNHFAILKNSKMGKFVMTCFGLFILAPRTIWKRSHDYHHKNNSRLSNNGVGAYPLLDRKDYLKLTKAEQKIYKAARHPFTIFLGYLSLFVFDFNIRTFLQSPKKHFDSFFSLGFHILVIVLLYKYFGVAKLLVCWIAPFVIANGLGAYLFYAQHNFPGAKYVANKEWEFTQAALMSTSFLKMNEVLNWFTGDIGYHHVHHLNHHIPFYRLREAMAAIPELQSPIETSFKLKDVMACLRLKVWDSEKNEMTPF